MTQSNPEDMLNLTLRGAAAFALIPILLLAGCAGKLERPIIPSVLVVPTPGKDNVNYTTAKYFKDLADYDAASKGGIATSTEAIRLRNKMAYSLLAEIDYVFGEYETKLLVTEGSFHIASDFLQLGLAAGSTIMVGARGKTILSGLLSGVTGTSLSIDKNFFRQQTVEALTSSMEANRDRIKTVIIQQLKQNVSTYPFEATRSDLIKYFFAGTLSGGMLELHQQSAVDAKKQQASMNLAQVTNISAEDVDTVGKLNAAIAKAFQSKNLSAVLDLLKAMGVATDGLNCQKGDCDAPSQAKVEAAIREIGGKITTDEPLRKKYFTEARTAKLIE